MNDASTVFVVDDDESVRKGLSLSLKQRGFRVESFASAEQFLVGVDKDSAGCLVLDVRMPGMTGTELQHEMASRGIRLPIIFISGHGNVPMATRTMRRGAIDFLEKPYSLDVLLERIGEALQVNSEHRETAAFKQKVHRRFERLSSREREVMRMIVAGAATATSKAVAATLGISNRTVDTYRARLMEKMRARSITELAEMARICGIYESRDQDDLDGRQ